MIPSRLFNLVFFTAPSLFISAFEGFFLRRPAPLPLLTRFLLWIFPLNWTTSSRFQLKFYYWELLGSFPLWLFLRASASLRLALIPVLVPLKALCRNSPHLWFPDFKLQAAFALYSNGFVVLLRSPVKRLSSKLSQPTAAFRSRNGFLQLVHPFQRSIIFFFCFVTLRSGFKVVIFPSSWNFLCPVYRTTIPCDSAPIIFLTHYYRSLAL